MVTATISRPATRRPAPETPDRWQKALRRAIASGIGPLQIAGTGEYVVTSATKTGTCYRSDGYACECEAAALGNDPVCAHRAVVLYVHYRLALRELTPAPIRRCPLSRRGRPPRPGRPAGARALRPWLPDPRRPARRRLIPERDSCHTRGRRSPPPRHQRSPTAMDTTTTRREATVPPSDQQHGRASPPRCRSGSATSRISCWPSRQNQPGRVGQQLTDHDLRPSLTGHRTIHFPKRFADELTRTGVGFGTTMVGLRPTGAASSSPTTVGRAPIVPAAALW